MRLTFVSTVLLAQALTTLCQQFPHQDPLTCEERAQLQGLPTDGWTVVYQDGQPMCQRVQQFCDGTEYTDADTKTTRCCSGTSQVTWINQNDKTGKCCPKDLAWSYDTDVSGLGACCPSGSHMQGGKCATDSQQCGNGPRKRCSVCTNYPVCGSGKSLGIKYGHCYILSFGDGSQLGTVRENTLYSKGGFFNDIPFKVCKSTDDCSPGKTVQMGESFRLEDQQGRYNDPKGTKGWIDNAASGAHIGFTLDAKAAGVFQGIPSCAGGECAIKVLGGPTLSPNAPTCPQGQSGISFFGNPKMHDAIRFSEVTCDDYEVPLTSGISPNVH